MNCHQCSTHITASDRSAVEVQCTSCEAIFCSQECFIAHMMEMVREEWRKETSLPLPASKESNDLNEAIAILVDEEDHTLTFEKAAELGDAEKIQSLFEAAVKEWKAGDSDEEFVAAILYLCALCCRATEMSKEEKPKNE